MNRLGIFFTDFYGILLWSVRHFPARAPEQERRRHVTEPLGSDADSPPVRLADNAQSYYYAVLLLFGW